MDIARFSECFSHIDMSSCNDEMLLYMIIDSDIPFGYGLF